MTDPRKHSTSATLGRATHAVKADLKPGHLWTSQSREPRNALLLRAVLAQWTFLTLITKRFPAQTLFGSPLGR